MRSGKSRRLILAAAAAATVLAGKADVAQADRYWVPTAPFNSGNWNTPAFWSANPGGGAPTGLPGVNDSVFIFSTDNLLRTITYDASSAYSSDFTVQIDNNGGGTNVLKQTAGALHSRWLNVGIRAGGDGRVDQSGGTRTLRTYLDIADTATSSGTYNLSGGSLDISGGGTGTKGLFVGFAGVGVFNQTGGTVTTGATVPLGIAVNPGSGGTYTMSGATSSYDGDGSAYVGGDAAAFGGNGVLNMQGGSMSIGGTLKVWNTAGTQVNLSGGTLSVGALDTTFNSSRFLGNQSTTGWTGGKLAVTGLGGLTVGSGGQLLNFSLASSRTLNVTNTLSILNGGQITVSNPSSLVAGGIDVTGTLDLSSISFDNPVQILTGGEVRGLGVSTYAGTISIPSGAAAKLTAGTNASDTFTIGNGANDLTGGGAGSTITVNNLNSSSTLILTQSSNYVGNWVVANGRLAISADDQLGAAANDVSLNGGNLRITSSLVSARDISADSSTSITTASSGVTFTLNGALGATANSISFLGAGTQVLGAPSARTGTSTVNQATVRLTNGSAMGTGAITVNGFGKLELGGVNNGQAITLSNTGTLRGTGTSGFTGVVNVEAASSVTLAATNATDLLFMGSIPNHITGGAGSTIHIAGSGVVDLPFGNPGYTGDWQVDSGTLRVGIASATSGATTPIVVNSGGTVEIDSVNWGRNLTLNSGSTLRGISDAHYSKTATVAAGASVTFAGATTTDELSNNVVGASIAGGVGATIHIGGAGAVEMVQPNTYAGDWVVDGGTFKVYTTGSTGTGVSPIVVNNGAALQLINGGGTYGRAITLNSGATARVQANSTTATGPILLNAGTETIEVGELVTLATSGGITSATTSTLQKIGDGTLAISNTNNFGGPVNIVAGTVQQTAGSSTVGVGALSRLTIGSSAGSTGTYELVGGSLTVDEERIGEPGNGAFIQSGGTHIISSAVNPLRIASAVGSNGSYSLSAGVLSVVNDAVSNGEAVGFNGTATFTQTGGTHTVGGINGNLVIGYAATGVGTYNMSGGSLTSNSLYVGRDAGATGTLNVNGGTVTVATEFLDLGLNVGATGTANINAGSITAQGIYVGGVSNQARGTGVLNVNGGAATSNGELRIWNTSGSAINLLSGSITTSTLNTSGNPARFNLAGGVLNITGPGGFTISPAGALGSTPAVVSGATINVTAATSIAAGSTLSVAGNYSTRAFGSGTGTLEIPGAGYVGTPANGASSGVSHLGALVMSAPGGATLNLNDNDLVVNNGNFSDVQALVLFGFGNTNGGIVSATSDGTQILALFDNALVGAAQWEGQAISANAIVGKYTYFGDANLDGQVTGDDSTVIDSALGQQVIAGMGWLMGDTNLDETISGDDYTVVDANLGLGVGNPLSPNARLSAVPEPSSVGLVVLLGGLVRRRRSTRG